jgi:exodeoxyribonuclease V alpha subunit
MNITDFKKLKNKDGFHEIDLQFANFILKTAKCNDRNLYLAAAIASHSIRNGSVCCNLETISGTDFPVYKSGVELSSKKINLPTITLPDFKSWTIFLSKYPDIISEYSYTPLILDSSNHLYLHRYWNYENKFAENILNNCKPDSRFINKLRTNQITDISDYFSSDTDIIDWQQIAIYTALANNFSIITGGPGTGKTTTVAAILAIILDIDPNLKIKICAPTGKAGSRLIEAINDEIDNLNPVNELLTIEKLKRLESYTVHRILGSLPLSPHFRHNSKNPIPADVIIIDEASMIPQTLFSKLLDAVSETTKIILLGDKDQLASVEAGAVMSNLCDTAEPNCFTESFSESIKKYFKQPQWKLETPTSIRQLNNTAVELKKSYRFSDIKGIGLLKNAINKDSDNTLELAKSSSEELILKPLPNRKNFIQSVIKHIQSTKVIIDKTSYNFTEFIKEDSPEQAYKVLNEFKILCSHNIGSVGVENLNKIVHDYFFNDPFHKLPIGTPIMILENNNQLKLYNGDTGIIWHDSQNSKKAFFPDSQTGKFRPFSIPLLPAYKEVFAMTVHKSQGSGFQNILIILPEIFSPILTKELIYTAITRAKHYCEIWSSDKVFEETTKHITRRDSGLMKKLTH